MTRDEIIRMAREVGILRTDLEVADFVEVIDLEIFADMVAKAEREACAEVIENISQMYVQPTWAFTCVKSIRARGQG